MELISEAANGNVVVEQGSSLLGQHTVYTVTDFASEYCGSGVFTDLSLTKTGNTLRLRFTVTQECVLVDTRVELCSEGLVNFAGLTRPQISVPQTSMITVVEFNAKHATESRSTLLF